MKKPIFILLLTALLLALLLIGCGQKTKGGDTPPTAIPADNSAGTGSNQPADDPAKDDEPTPPQDTQADNPENTPESPESNGKTVENETLNDETGTLLDSILEQLDSLDKLYSDLEADNLSDSDLTD